MARERTSTCVSDRAQAATRRAAIRRDSLPDGHDHPGACHGDRAGTHGVPAGLVIGAPDHRSVAVRLERPVHHVARVQRDASPRDALALLVYFRARLAPPHPGRSCRHPRSIVQAAIPIASSRGCWSLRRSRPPSSAPCSATSSRRQFREIGLVAVTLVVGGVILWIADRVGPRTRTVDDVTFPVAVGIGVAQALALVPGISRSGISISAGRFAGLDRESAARFAFLMATPITAGADPVRGVASS